MEADAAGRLAIGGLHTRAAARAMAVMHVNGSIGVVCAAPTGGSAGVLPGVLVTLVEERELSRARALCRLRHRRHRRRPGDLRRRGGGLPGRDRRGRRDGSGRRRGRGWGHRPPVRQRRRHRLPEHDEVCLRSGPRHGRDPVPLAQRGRRVERACLRRPRARRLREPHPTRRDNRCGVRRGEDEAVRASLHRERRPGGHADGHDAASKRGNREDTAIRTGGRVGAFPPPDDPQGDRVCAWGHPVLSNADAISRHGPTSLQFPSVCPAAGTKCGRLPLAERRKARQNSRS
jgi:hypothetical protein